MASLRSALYLFARIMGDFNAIQRGPEAIGRRLARRALGKLSQRTIMRLVPPMRRKKNP